MTARAKKTFRREEWYEDFMPGLRRVVLILEICSDIRLFYFVSHRKNRGRGVGSTNAAAPKKAASQPKVSIASNF